MASWFSLIQDGLESLGGRQQQQEEDGEDQQGAMLSLHLDLASQLTKNKRRQHGNLSLCIVIFISMVLSAQ